MKNAVMIIIKKENNFLMGKRSSWKQKAPGYWCPISGHVEENETEERAVEREAFEEIGVRVRPLRKITMIPAHDKSVMLHWWLAEIISGEPQISNNENSELRWFSKSELQTLEPVFKEDIEILLGF